MPQPSREQFERIAAKIAAEREGNPPSREEFFALIKQGIEQENYRPTGRPAPASDAHPLSDDPEASTFLSDLAGMMQSAANPQTVGDFLQLVIPSLPGNVTQQLTKTVGRGMEKTGRAIDRAGKAFPMRRSLTPSILGGYATQSPETTAAIIGAPYAARGIGKTIEAGGKFLQKDRLFTSRTPVAAAVDAATPPRPGMAPRLAGKAPTLEDALMDALNEVRSATPQPMRSTAPPPPSTTPAGTIRQSGTFRRADKLGQPGGYTSGRPSTMPSSLDDTVRQLMSEMPESVPSAPVAAPPVAAPAPVAAAPTTAQTVDIPESVLNTLQPPPGKPAMEKLFTDVYEPRGARQEWHSGHMQGTPEAARSSRLHVADAALDDDFARMIADPRGSANIEALIASLTAGGAAAGLTPELLKRLGVTRE